MLPSNSHLSLEAHSYHPLKLRSLEASRVPDEPFSCLQFQLTLKRDG